MYLEHYGLRELPFSLTPDTSFFFGYGHYRDAFNTLIVALQNGEGFIKVTGEVGTGKTLLCRKLLNSLGNEFATAYIPNPYLTPSALILAVADELGLNIDANAGMHRTLKQITQQLIKLGTEGKKVVLCIDEAQAMPEQTLETLRLVTNLETEKRKLLHVVLFGQPELDERLSQKSARQLRQRITFSYSLQPIDAQGLDAYLKHRLLIAGGNGEVGFDEAAVKNLYRGSRGFPRLVNILAHKALMLGYGQGIKRIGAEQVKAAIADTEGSRQLVKKPPKQGLLPHHLLSATLALALLLVLAYHFLAPLNKADALPVSVSEAEALTPPPQPVTQSLAPASYSNGTDLIEEINATDTTISSASLRRVTPSIISGSWEPQTLLLHGEAIPANAQLIVSWAGREKLLPADRIEWLNQNSLRVTLTTGVRSELWHIQLVDTDGQRSDAVSFEVVGNNQAPADGNT